LEYESKEILNKYQIVTPSGALVSSLDTPEIKFSVMLKAQIPIGGRGKTGAILEASENDAVKAGIEKLLSTQVRGYKARKILVEEKLDIEREFYMAVTYDTVAKSPMAIFSSEGGIDIEALAKRTPQKVRNEHFPLLSRLPQYRAREIISETGVSGRLLLGLGNILSGLADIFLDNDATLAEINPLALTHFPPSESG
jgi:succinyl-CoA synthetase beta subunit